MSHGPPTFRNASLLELVARNHKGPSPPTPRFALTDRPIAKKNSRINKESKSEMGFQRTLRRINMGPATGKEKRGRLRKKPKQSISSSKIPLVPSRHERERSFSPNISPYVRIGASKTVLITLDSDSKESVLEDMPNARGRDSQG